MKPNPAINDRYSIGEMEISVVAPRSAIIGPATAVQATLYRISQVLSDIHAPSSIDNTLLAMVGEGQIPGSVTNVGKNQVITMKIPVQYTEDQEKLIAEKLGVTLTVINEDIAPVEEAPQPTAVVDEASDGEE